MNFHKDNDKDKCPRPCPVALIIIKIRKSWSNINTITIQILPDTIYHNESVEQRPPDLHKCKGVVHNYF